MDELSDLAPELRLGDHLFKVDVSNGYFHLKLRSSNSMHLAFFVGHQAFIPLNLDCGLSPVTWFFTKAMAPVVGFLRSLGHRIFAYLDEFFGAAKPLCPGGTASPVETQALERLMQLLFHEFGLQIHPKKCFFHGFPRLELLGILVDTESQQFLLPPKKLCDLARSSDHLLRHASRHRSFVRVKGVQRFASLAKSAAPDIVDHRLRLRELFNCLTPAATSLRKHSSMRLENSHNPRDISVSLILPKSAYRGPLDPHAAICTPQPRRDARPPVVWPLGDQPAGG